MVHYWGAKAILERCGYSPKSYRLFPAFIIRHQIPCYPKTNPRLKRPMYYSNDELMARMELSKAKQSYERLVAKYGSKEELRKQASERTRERQSRVA